MALCGLCFLVAAVPSRVNAQDRVAPAADAAANAVSSVARPSYIGGNGPFVLNGNLYDRDGREFRVRGVNRVHWDSGSEDGIAKSGSNTVRWALDFTRPARSNVELVRVQSVQHGEIPIVGNWTATCKTDTASLEAVVATWVAQAARWKALSGSLIVNIANEWGPANSAVWRDAYINAVGRLRSAGYTQPILIDSGGCGQDDGDLVQYSQAVFNSDPEHNVMFALHIYGETNDYSASIKSITKGKQTVITLNSTNQAHPFAPKYNGNNNNYSGITAYQIDGVEGMTQINGRQPAPQNVGGTPGAWTITLTSDSTNWPAYIRGGTLVDYNGNYALRIARLAALSRRTGAAYIVGEFGPGRNIGPSPTLVTPAEIIASAEAANIGWLAWAWDDNNLANCSSNDDSFDMTYHCGAFSRASDLTNFGKEVVLNPVYGLNYLAVRTLASGHGH